MYLTLVDDQGIDCVVRQDSGRYYDVQIKARSKDGNPRNAGHFPLLAIDEPRRSYVFVFYSERARTYWVIPSTTLVTPGFCNVVKSGPSQGRYRILLTNYSTATGEVTPRPKYREYEHAFEAAFGAPLLQGETDPSE